jgi:hypothetical protein
MTGVGDTTQTLRDAGCPAQPSVGGKSQGAYGKPVLPSFKNMAWEGNARLSGGPRCHDIR